MSSRRPLRTLAAWGYHSAATGARIEVDVWTINPPDDDDGDDLERARRKWGHRDDITPLETYGNVAKVHYENLGNVGYRYISTDEKATQQAFAGAKRSAGGPRTPEGTMGEGYSPPDWAPDLRDVVAHGEAEVLPAVRQEFMELGAAITRDPPADEENEPVPEEPFEGFKNVVRAWPYGDSGPVYRYRVVRGELRSYSGGALGRGT